MFDPRARALQTTNLKKSKYNRIEYIPINDGNVGLIKCIDDNNRLNSTTKQYGDCVFNETILFHRAQQLITFS